MKKGRFDEIGQETRVLRSTPSTVAISKRMIERRMQRKNLALSNVKGSKESPLTAYEDCVVEMIIKLSRCRHSITTTEGLQLVSSLIIGAPIANHHRECKLANTHVENPADVDGSVGCGSIAPFKEK